MRVAALVLAAALAGWPAAAQAAQGERCGDWPAWTHNEFPDVDSVNLIAVAGEEVRLNGAPLDMARLARRLRRDGRAPRPPATTLFLGMDVDCALVERVRALIAGTMPCDEDLCVEIHDQPVLPRVGAADELDQVIADLEAAADELRDTVREESEPPKER